jgi:ATP-dependent DNA helicase 2 subunit 1
VQALALEEELPEKPDDKTIPKYKQIDKRAGEFIHNWGVILDGEARAYEVNQILPFLPFWLGAKSYGAV